MGKEIYLANLEPGCPLLANRGRNEGWRDASASPRQRDIKIHKSAFLGITSPYTQEPAV
jgi:hypothetical protein